MLEKIKDLPTGVLGLRAKGRISKDDYEDVVLPSFEAARQKGERIRFLYQFGPDFDGFTARAAWEDMRLGMRYLRLFERCAVVSDLPWIRRATRAIGVTMPCPVRVFENDRLQAAAAWLKDLGTTLRHIRFVRDHHRKIQRLAWVVDGKLTAIGPSLAAHFVEAEIRHFDADDIEAAIAWAAREGTVADS